MAFQKGLYLLITLFGLVLGQTPRGCRHDLPTLSVRDGKDILDLGAWDKVKKKNELIIIGVADS
jgi:hypothetical protein